MSENASDPTVNPLLTHLSCVQIELVSERNSTGGCYIAFTMSPLVYISSQCTRKYLLTPVRLLCYPVKQSNPLHCEIISA